MLPMRSSGTSVCVRRGRAWLAAACPRAACVCSASSDVPRWNFDVSLRAVRATAPRIRARRELFIVSFAMLSPFAFYIAKGVSSSIGHAPYFSGAVVGDEQRAVAEDEKAGGAAP